MEKKNIYIYIYLKTIGIFNKQFEHLVIFDQIKKDINEKYFSIIESYMKIC